ncbi:putative Glycerol-3-phosphate acyltransferase 3 [Melia azedarach]|uniref:Glycerol-3-phosphate acyltransferase 3 n=1 Tax=Melia azedarach TaxID=155640 RepID=A0ACC1YXB7_MELAZ|nr:putative Glycerol-3-phosphate acyltransferase 3 [Melia azedarach]
MYSMKFSFFKTLFFFFCRILFRQFRNPKVLHRTVSNLHAAHNKYQKYTSLVHRSDLSDKTLIFNVEQVLLKSSSLFPYFMLVAFEAGGLLRAFALFILYPFICFIGGEMGLKIMVAVCFFGIKKDSFRVGRAVLPKFFLENVGLEIFEVLKRGGKRVAVTNMPQVMIESFLRDYLEIDHVVGKELKVFCGYFVGLIEERKQDLSVLQDILGEEKDSDHIIGISSLNHKLFLKYCKEVYLVRSTDKKSWQHLPRDKYPKPLIFHDGRLAFRPTLSDSLVMFMWVPFGLILAITRATVALTLPHKISIPALTFSGLLLTVTEPKTSHSFPNSKDCKKPQRLLYVCNHRTLLDPLYLSFTLKKNITAVTYSLSRMSELLAPIKTVRLTRNRDQDAKMMERLLNQGDLVICPEGTTCREPYLLRFSPLFAEMSDHIIPVASNTHVTMFYGTTAGGLKCLDPLFFLLNPSPNYTMQLLQGVCGLSTCNNGEKSRFDVANYVQSELGKALGFECTKLTRRDKYQILAGNDGIAAPIAKS